MKKLGIIGAVTSFALLLSVTASASTISVSTGDLGNNVIAGSVDYFWNPVLTAPIGSGPDELDIKYGLWNTPEVPVNVFVNGTLAGSFVATSGYIAPGPQFTSVDVSGLLLDGVNQIRFTGSSTGDYVIGQIDVTYDSASAPEPTSLLLFGSGALGVFARMRRRKQQ